MILSPVPNIKFPAHPFLTNFHHGIFLPLHPYDICLPIPSHPSVKNSSHFRVVESR
ncbi:hypothetical protein EX30DRAFT_345020 [Ascodesmis nigricans]|uniref:Uncharacterized protein n=1 Tax=Ascodesmis nigricans TaxID=341454 RepID=A0A4S2MHD6_9PEZI|nr:hypothetical protein EX30DRAFT_345020 [Ascodesmis nigricans]